MIRLETERLVLRNYKPEDFNDVFAYFSHPEVAEYEDFHPMTEAEVRELIDDWKNKDNRLVAQLKECGTVIGSVGYFIDDDGDYSIDFDFNPAYGKHGYATEAARAVLNHLFNTLNAEKVYGDCDIRNVNSWKLLEHLGFERVTQIDDESYKDDADGNPIPISIYLYAAIHRPAL